MKNNTDKSKGNIGGNKYFTRFLAKTSLYYKDSKRTVLQKYDNFLIDLF